MDVILGIDQGTTATKAVLVGEGRAALATAPRALDHLYPQPGWVEMDPAAIWRSLLSAAAEAVDLAQARGDRIRAVGLANQGESVVAWDAETGEALHHVITWQCARTAERCAELAATVDVAALRAKTGLLLDPYFSATKLQWLLERVPAVQAARRRGSLRLGTLDSWMIWRLSGGRAFVTDYTTASRTLLFDLHALDWDEGLLALFGVPRWALPQPRPSACLLGETDPAAFLGLGLPIAGSAVDQPAALFAHGCCREGALKITYGTGAFLLMNIGQRFRLSQHGLLTSLAATGEGEPVQYYLDGGIYSVGAALDWLRDNLGLVAEAGETAALAESLPDNGGVYFVPALAGLAAPLWDRQARAAFLGLTSATTRAHLARAVLESIAYRVLQVVHSMEADAGAAIGELRADGGVARNDFLMQFQADLLGVPVQRSRLADMTALGAARLAGLAIGLWDRAALSQPVETDRFLPGPRATAPLESFHRWEEALAAARAFG